MTNNEAQSSLARDLAVDGYTDVIRLLADVPPVITSVWAKTDDDGDTVVRVLAWDVIIGNLIIFSDKQIHAETWSLGIYGGASTNDAVSVVDAMEWITETCDLDI